MDPTDAFFTQTIVGAPLTVLLGRRQVLPGQASEGIEISLALGESRLSTVWNDWAVLSHACDPVGQPRMRPGPLRRWLERRALLLGVSGLLAVVGSVIFWGVQTWI